MTAFSKVFNMILFLIWLADVISTIHCVLNAVFGFSVILFVCGVAVFIINADRFGEDEIRWNDWGKTKAYLAIKIAVISMLVSIVVPSKNTYYAMVGVYMGKEIISNPTSQRLFEKSIQAIELKLDEVINSDLKNDK